VVVWGGTKDVARNRTQKGLIQLKNIVENHKQTNIFVMSIPHRYDIQINSGVNNEIQVFSTKLRTQQKVSGNAFLIEVNADRYQFTRPGLHLNSKEKEQSAKKIVNTVKDTLNKT
jgi:hypothetical protein